VRLKRLSLFVETEKPMSDGLKERRRFVSKIGVI
jgi:hypothetical protein